MQLGLGMGWLDTTLRFGGDLEADLEMTAISLSGAFPLKERMIARASIGVLIDGSVQPDEGTEYTFEPGGLVSLGLEYQARENRGWAPSVDLTFLLGVTWAKTRDPGTGDLSSYLAGDFRVGARAAWKTWDFLYPFAGARVFGGPVSWELDGEDRTGSDVHHYQLAIGAAAQIGPAALFFEWAGLGERGISAGVGTAW